MANPVSSEVLSFEDMKAEFLSMDLEIKEKTAEIEKLKAQLKEREGASNKMVDQMEELHENLADLDARFERSKKQNEELRKEKEERQREYDDELKSAQENLENTRIELNGLRNEYQEYRNETDGKLQSLRESFKQSIEDTKYPISSYLEKNKGSKTPMKKTKGYRLLKTVDSDLKNILSTTMNNNVS